MRFPIAAPDFDRRASQYEHYAWVQRAAAHWLAEWLPSIIEGPALELGAGTGIFTQHVAAACDQLVATDISPRMVKTAARNLSGPIWTVAAADNPPADSIYRCIISCSLAQWLADPAATLARWRALTAPGAKLIAGWFIRGTMRELLETSPETSPIPWRSADEWFGFMQKSGWALQRHETRTFELKHPNTAALLRDLHNLGAIVPRRFTAAQLRRVIRAHDQHHSGSGFITTPFVFMRVEAINP